MKVGSDVLKRVRPREKNVTSPTCTFAAIIGRFHDRIAAHTTVEPLKLEGIYATFSLQDCPMVLDVKHKKENEHLNFIHK